MKAATGKDIAEHVIRLAKDIPATLIMVSYAPLHIRIVCLPQYPMNMQEWWSRMQVGKTLTEVLMLVPIE
jgi:hypothetical protein